MRADCELAWSRRCMTYTNHDSIDNEKVKTFRALNALQTRTPKTDSHQQCRESKLKIMTGSQQGCRIDKNQPARTVNWDTHDRVIILILHSRRFNSTHASFLRKHMQHECSVIFGLREFLSLEVLNSVILAWGHNGRRDYVLARFGNGVFFFFFFPFFLLFFCPR